MRLTTLALAIAFTLGMPCANAFAQSDLPPNPASTLAALNLQRAWQLAQDANPVLRSKLAQKAAVQGAQDEAAGLLFNNPILALERTRRTVPADGSPNESRQEWGAGLSQTFEIAGQQGLRRASARSAAEALDADIADTRGQLMSSVAQQLFRVLVLQQRVDLETEALRLFSATATAIEKRRAAGEDTRLDANVAVVESERARNQLSQVQEQLMDARGELAASLQIPLSALPTVEGDLTALTPTPPLAEFLDRSALQPRLRALAAREQSQRAKLRLEQASRWPDVTVGLNVGHEGPEAARERLTTVTLSLPLPMFRRNAAAIGQATAELTQAEIDHQAARQASQNQVQALWRKLSSLEARVQRLQQTVLPTLIDNLRLSEKSQRAGQIGVLDVIVVNRQALDARRDLLDALSEYHTTRFALQAAAGTNQE